MLRRLLVWRFWNRWFDTGGIRTWMHEPAARRRVNLRITGHEHRWPLEWLADRGLGPYGRAASLGCGEGALERDLVGKGLVREIVGVDLSPRALRTATERAAAEGLEGLHYRRANLDRLDLGDDRFDAVFAHQALHHVRELEACLAEVERCLRSGGLLYLDEYLGPSRHQWSRELLEEAERVFETLPGGWRRGRRLHLPVDWRDPSEAVRSSEILPLLEERFSLVEKRPYGGNLLSVIHPHLDLEGVSGAEREGLIEELLDREDALLAAGVPSYYAVVLARKRT